MSDNELIGYSLIHCRTEVAAFHKRDVARLLRLAGDTKAADDVDDHFREWYHLGPGVIQPIVDEIRKKEEAAKAPDWSI